MGRNDSLGDRIKRYEAVSKHHLTRRCPVIIRVDGKAFHTLTRNCIKPFDSRIMDAMVNSAVRVARNMQGFKAAYVQSDEVTFLLTDYDTITTDAWFGYSMQKLTSISAAMMSVAFNRYCPDMLLDDSLTVFDSRAFNVPHDDVVNTFLWRAQDWKRNSMQMLAGAHFSHNQLLHKSTRDMHDMLREKGINWTTDLSSQERNGTFVLNEHDGIGLRSSVLPTHEAISGVLDTYLHP